MKTGGSSQAGNQFSVQRNSENKLFNKNIQCISWHLLALPAEISIKCVKIILMNSDALTTLVSHDAGCSCQSANQRAALR